MDDASAQAHKDILTQVSSHHSEQSDLLGTPKPTPKKMSITNRKSFLKKTAINQAVKENQERTVMQEKKREITEVKRVNKEEMEKRTQQNKEEREEIVKELKKISTTLVDELKDGFQQLAIAITNNKGTDKEKIDKENEEQDYQDPLIDPLMVPQIETELTQVTVGQPTAKETYRTSHLNQRISYEERQTQAPINNDDWSESTQRQNKDSNQHKERTIDRQITRENLLIIIENQQDTINSLNKRIQQIENKLAINPNPVNKMQYSKVVQNGPRYQPAPKIDSEGEDIEDSTDEQDNINHKPYDYTTVTTSRKFLKPRPELTQSQNKQVDLDLKKYKQEIENNPIKHKPKPETKMTNERRIEEIQDMLADDALYIGVAPITREKINRVRNILTAKGTFRKKDPVEIRTQRTIKSLLKGWARKNLLIKDNDWEKIDFEEIIQAGGEESDLIFLKCSNTEDAAFVTSHAKNLPRDPTGNGPRLVQHIDRRAKSRYKAYNAVAKSLREQSKFTQQTNLRIGKNDYLLRQREKGSTTPWNQIPPNIIKHKLPPFEIGMYTQLDDTESSSSSDESNTHEDQEDYEMLEEDINQQYRNDNQNNKENTSTSTKRQYESSESDTDSNKGEGEMLSSTLKSTESSKNKQTKKPNGLIIPQFNHSNQKETVKPNNKTLVPETPIISQRSEQQTVPDTPAITNNQPCNHPTHDE